MKKIIVFDKGGRKERIKLIKKNNAPKDFLQGLDTIISQGFNIKHLSSTKKYKQKPIFLLGKYIEEFFCKLSNIGIRPLSVYQFRNLINSSNYIVSFTDGFSLSLGFYYSFIDKRNQIKLAGAFHRLSDYNSKLPKLLRKIYYLIFLKILKRLDYIIFYGEADRLNAIKHFNLEKNKTYIIKFGVDINFWKPSNKETFNSKYLFSIGQDPARDFKTLLKVNTKKKIHIHTILLNPINKKNLKITNGSYYKHKNSFSDLKIRELYQESFAIVIPLKNVFQPSGYSVTLQAMACGKPVILTKTKGLWAPSLFKNMENCILVNPYKSNEIENAISLLENNKNLYQKICKRARKTAVDHFSLEVANKSTLKLFKNFI